MDSESIIDYFDFERFFAEAEAVFTPQDGNDFDLSFTRNIQYMQTPDEVAASRSTTKRSWENSPRLTPSPSVPDSFLIVDNSNAPSGVETPNSNQVSEPRRMGSCVRCAILKAACDLGNPCSRCEKDMKMADINHGPCYREDIMNVGLVRLGSGKANQPRLAFIDYLFRNPSAPLKLLQMSWQLPDETVLELPTWEAPLNEFLPRKDIDLVHEEWHVAGELVPRKVSLPAYASADKIRLTKCLQDFIEASRPRVHAMMLNSIDDPLTRLTFHEADRYTRTYGSSIIDLAFRVRTTAILSAGWGSIVGTLGTPYFNNAELVYCGRRPIPVPLSHQIDVIFVNIMEHDERALAWFEIFLAYFIITTHLKYIHCQAVGFMRSRERTDSAGQVSYMVKNMIRKWEYSAGNMMYQFNHILNGEKPFAIAAQNLAEVRKLGELDDTSVAYMQAILIVLEESGISPESSNDEAPEDDAPSDRWIYQLFRKS